MKVVVLTFKYWFIDLAKPFYFFTLSEFCKKRSHPPLNVNIPFPKICYSDFQTSAVADPGFSWGEGAPTSQSGCTNFFLPKTAPKSKNLDPRAARVPGAAPWISQLSVKPKVIKYFN